MRPAVVEFYGSWSFTSPLSFHQVAHEFGICTGPGLTCMNHILRFIGKLNKVQFLLSCSNKTFFPWYIWNISFISFHFTGEKVQTTIILIIYTDIENNIFEKNALLNLSICKNGGAKLLQKKILLHQDYKNWM